ncbi:MAG: hypothetical protein J1F29_01835 [Lentimicrobiaceae bacterium]|nr:hypothetical protein [Lentimicrobiaceae bacterium]
MDSGYIKDSYNYLSIEGYKVTEELLERIRSGGWNPKKNQEDKERKYALAARGYYQAYQSLSRGISDVLAGGDAAQGQRTSRMAFSTNLFIFANNCQ